MNAGIQATELVDFKTRVNHFRSKLVGSKSPEEIKNIGNHCIMKLNSWMDEDDFDEALSKVVNALIDSLKYDPALGLAIMEALEDKAIDYGAA